MFDDPGDDAKGNALLRVDVSHDKTDIIFLPRHAPVQAGVGDGVDAVGQADKDNTFVDVGHLAGVLALDAAFFEIVLVSSTGYALAYRPVGMYR